MGPPNGLSFFARSGSTWINWWSPVASANWFTRSWVISTQSLWPNSLPTRLCTPSRPSTIVCAMRPAPFDSTTLANSTTPATTREERVAPDRCAGRARRRVRADGDREPDTRLVLRPRRHVRHGRRPGTGRPGRRRGRRHGGRRGREGGPRRGGRRRGGDRPYRGPGPRDPLGAPHPADLDRHVA